MIIGKTPTENQPIALCGHTRTRTRREQFQQTESLQSNRIPNQPHWAMTIPSTRQAWHNRSSQRILGVPTTYRVERTHTPTPSEPAPPVLPKDPRRAQALQRRFADPVNTQRPTPPVLPKDPRRAQTQRRPQGQHGTTRPLNPPEPDPVADKTGKHDERCAEYHQHWGNRHQTAKRRSQPRVRRSTTTNKTSTKAPLIRKQAKIFPPKLTIARGPCCVEECHLQRDSKNCQMTSIYLEHCYHNIVLQNAPRPKHDIKSSLTKELSHGKQSFV